MAARIYYESMQYEVRLIKSTPALQEFINQNHYTGSTPRATHWFGLFEGETLKGVCGYGHFTRDGAARKYFGDLELVRLVMRGVDKNTGSFFISRTLHWLKQHTATFGIITYADPTEGHTGTVYRAANFQQVGTSRSSYHYLDSAGKRIHKKRIWREARSEGISELQHAQDLELTKIKELPKLIFRYQLREGKPTILGTVYRLTNTANDLVYIGITVQSIDQRFKSHLSSAKNGDQRPVCRAIRGLGPERFIITAIERQTSLTDLQDREAHWIAHHDATNPLKGYNVAQGYSDDSYCIPDEIFWETMLLRRQGFSMQEIADQVGVNSETIGKVHSGRHRSHLAERFEKEVGALPLPRKISLETQEQIFEMYDKGFRPSRIARLMDFSRTYVLKILNGEINPELYAEWIKTHPKPQTERALVVPVEKIPDLYRAYYIEQKPVEELEQQYNVSLRMWLSVEKDRPRFKAWWEQNGRPERKPLIADPVWTPEKLERARELKAKGHYSQEIADEIGVSASYINKVLRAGKPKTKKLPARRILRPEWRIEGETVCFYTPKDAAEFCGVVVQSFLRSLKRDKPVGGQRWHYLP